MDEHGGGEGHVGRFETEVFPVELEEISRRQEVAIGCPRHGVVEVTQNGARSPSTGHAAIAPSTNLRLVGLALSGGGIRSAAFSLGVVQSLIEKGIFRQFDYLSTVSGGGFTGGALTSLLNQRDGAPYEQLLELDEIGRERPAARRLRSASSYLASGAVETARVPLLVLRGLLLHLAVLFTYLVAAVWLTEAVCGDRLRSALQRGQAPSFLYYTSILWWVFLGHAVLFPLLERSWIGFVRRFGRGWRWLANGGSRDPDPKHLPRGLYSKGFTFLLVTLLIVGALEMLPSLLAAFHLALAGYPEALSLRGPSTLRWPLVLVSVIFLAIAAATMSRLSKLPSFSLKLAVASLAVAGPVVVLLGYLYLGSWAIYGAAPAYWPSAFLDSPIASWQLFRGLPKTVRVSGWPELTIAALLVWLYTLRYLDPNTTSLHHFYRDRLSQSFLFRVDEEQQIVSAELQRLSDLASDRSGAPYPLINAALNLHAAVDPELRSRSTAPFLFSRHFIGSEHTGYCYTRDIESVDRELTHAAAIAISGAAATPSLGSQSRLLVFALALLNIRLDYWLPNPRTIKGWKDHCVFRMGAGRIYLLRELFNRLDINGWYVNVSDGGHFENLGAYELLRRRCKYVVVSDAEADPNRAFDGLAHLIRRAEIELGTKIEIDLEDLRPNEQGMSRSHAALGRILYPGNERGQLLYIKATLCGDEPEPVLNYQYSHRRFPHEPTSDQFFDPEQFDAYRSLGRISGESLFRRGVSYLEPTVDVYADRYGDPVGRWFTELKTLLAPRFRQPEAFVDLNRQLSRFESEVGEELTDYVEQLYPEIQAEEAGALQQCLEGDASAKTLTRVFSTCRRQIHFMEGAVVRLDLSRLHYYRRRHLHGSWVQLFQRWSRAPCFRFTWSVSTGTYSVAFEQFCEEVLGLKNQIRWQRLPHDELSADELTFVERPVSGATGKAGSPLSGDGFQDQLWAARLGSVLLPRSAIEDPADDTWLMASRIGFVQLRFAPEPSRPDSIELVALYLRPSYRHLVESVLGTLRVKLVESYPRAELVYGKPKGLER